MGMTVVEKILARAAGVPAVRPGEFLLIEPHLGLANDITAPLSLEEFDRVGAQRVFDPEKVAQAFKAGRPFKTLQPAIRAGEFRPEQTPSIGLPV